jgi:hypothetical protein
MDFVLVAKFQSNEFVAQDVVNAIESFLPYMADNVSVEIREVE